MLQKDTSLNIKNLFRDPEFLESFDRLVEESLKKNHKNQFVKSVFTSTTKSKVADKFFVRNDILSLVYFSPKDKEEKRLPVYKDEYIKGIELIYSGITPTESQLIKINRRQIMEAKKEALCDDNKIRYIKRFLVAKGILKKRGKLVYLMGEKETFHKRCMDAWTEAEG